MKINKTLSLVAAAGMVVGISGCVGDDKNLWISDNDGDLGYVNVETGEVTLVGNTGVTMTDIAFDPEGNLYGITFTDLYSIDKETGVATLIGNHQNDSGAKNALVFSKDGTLYSAWDALYTIDPATGMSTLIGNAGDVYRSSGDLAFFKDELYMSSHDEVNGGDELLVMSTLDGSALGVGSLGEEATFYGLSANKNTLYTVQGTTIYSVDPETGVLTEEASFADQGLGAGYGSAFETEAK